MASFRGLSEDKLYNYFRTARVPLLIGVLFLCGSATSWAGVTSCNGTVAAITAAGGSTPASGCGQFDLGFSNIVIGDNGDGNVPIATASQVNLAATGGTAGPTTTMAPIDLNFSSNN